jgi:hypothetical protein
MLADFADEGIRTGGKRVARSMSERNIGGGCHRKTTVTAMRVRDASVAQ